MASCDAAIKNVAGPAGGRAGEDASDEKRPGGPGPGGYAAARGKPVQVDPIKPTSKAPGSERLTLKCDDLLSNFAFILNLRRYTAVETAEDRQARCRRMSITLGGAVLTFEAGAYTRPPVSST
jgi:hypothetical protein